MTTTETQKKLDHYFWMLANLKLNDRHIHWIFQQIDQYEGQLKEDSKEGVK